VARGGLRLIAGTMAIVAMAPDPREKPEVGAQHVVDD
jgi:hypothetical protein